MTTLKRFVCSVLVAVATLALGATGAWAQDISGSISGTVTDTTGAIVKGAIVAVANTDRGQVLRTLTTNGSGFYTATSLPVGNYTVKITAEGFKTETVTGLVLHVNDALTVNRSLVAGSATEEVTVTADQVQLNLENGMSQGLINGVQIRELALNNRNYEQLLLLQPGVSYGGASDQLYIGTSLPSGTSAQVAFSINGSRPTSNNWTIDGADNVDRGANLTLLSYPSVDAISEFKTLRGTYTSEFGRNASGQIDVITRSGTNAFHGSAYEFFRNNIFNANSYFNKVATLVNRPLLRYNDFGYTIGGPVVIPHVYNGKDKTFFFFSQEIRRVINYATAQAFLPTTAELAGDFTQGFAAKTNAQGPVAVCTSYTQSGASYTCNSYGTKVTTFSPTAQAYIKDIYGKMPQPNVAANLAAGLDPHSYIYNQRNIFNNNQELVRIDQYFGKLSVFYRYLHDSLPSQEAGGLFNGSPLPGVPTTSTRSPGTQQLGHATYTFTPTLVADVGYAYSYGGVLSNPIGLGAQVNSPDIHPTLPFATSGVPSSTALNIIPSVSIAGLTGVTNTGVYNDTDHNHNVYGSVTKTLGRHTFKTGFTYNHYEKHENALGNGNPFPQGNFGFTNAGVATPTAAQAAAAGGAVPNTADAAFANFLTGNVNNSFTQASAALTVNIVQNSVEAYAQDDWKVNPRLTLNLGVRYSYFAQPTDSNNLLSNFDPSSFNPANAMTVSSTGVLCLPNVTACANSNGLNLGHANPNGDRINGIILGTPGNFGHASPYGAKVATAQKGNFAPRFGFAYDVFGDGKTALRGGFGMAYDQSQVHPYENNAFSNLPFVNVPTIPVTTFDNPAGGTAAVSTALPSVQGFSVHYQTPYTMQYSLDVQHAVSSTVMLDVGYFGSVSRHLEGVVDLNTLRPGTFLAKGLSQYAVCSGGFTSTSCEQQLNQIRPYPGYLNVNITSTIFTANYNGLQVKTTKKFSGQSYIDANYTWSRALTNSINDYVAAPQNVYNINGDYGRAVYDRTNIITFDGVYELPWYRDQKGVVGHLVGGWQLTGLYTINSGLPLTVTLSSSGGTICYTCTASASQTSVLGLPNGGVINDSAGLGIMNGPDPASLRPNQVLNPNNGYGQRIHTRLNWFYRPAFVSPTAAAVQVGNEKRGAINGPGFNRLDVGIFRNFKISEGMKFQLRGEAFNAANHTNFQAVGTSGASTTTFGQVTSARDNRIMQVAGKFTF
ncbi:TonB-dependent receptor [Edaphobacter bradus]|uniref:TonB-dependent receptor n=1 Tax=Edaphobacter bradus TaxID=2259016 RepID=UPI0021E075C1|nr:TonB-dependent receptor [Edaphobacter bradus]